MSQPAQVSSTQALQAHVREIGKLAEVVGALAKEFERHPRVDVLVSMKERVARLSDEWAKTEAILSAK